MSVNQLRTIDLTPRIGTELFTDAPNLLSGTHTKQIRDLLEQRGVLIFRGINFDDEQQLAFSETIGQIFQQGKRGIVKITLDENESSTAQYLHGTFFWHIDGAQDDVPTRASLLSARTLASEGGQTEFANTYAAYDDLPDDEKKALAEIRIQHSQVRIQLLAKPDISDNELSFWQNMEVKTHPLVWTHETGRKSLVLGLTASGVEGMDNDEGLALIDRLQDWSTQPQFVYQHQWQPGDLLIWDNTGCMHRVVPYAADSGRMMHRTTLVGEESLV